MPNSLQFSKAFHSFLSFFKLSRYKFCLKKRVNSRLYLSCKIPVLNNAKMKHSIQCCFQFEIVTNVTMWCTKTWLLFYVFVAKTKDAWGKWMKMHAIVLISELFANPPSSSLNFQLMNWILVQCSHKLTRKNINERHLF